MVDDEELHNIHGIIEEDDELTDPELLYNDMDFNLGIGQNEQTKLCTWFCFKLVQFFCPIAQHVHANYINNHQNPLFFCYTTFRAILYTVT